VRRVGGNAKLLGKVIALEETEDGLRVADVDR